MSRETMSYFRTRMRQLRSEYLESDRGDVIAAAGSECSICHRKKGDEFLFGPTNYLKKKIRFLVYIDIHVIEGGQHGRNTVVMCNGCHMSYHLFTRLTEEAEMGEPLSKTVYPRCRGCSELKAACMCCTRCNRASKWCRCDRGPLRKRKKK